MPITSAALSRRRPSSFLIQILAFERTLEYSGGVIATVVGSGERKNFTVIGDSVNIAARLCSIASEGQIVVDCETIQSISPRPGGYGPEEVITVKGRDGLLKVCRWSIFYVR